VEGHRLSQAAEKLTKACGAMEEGRFQRPVSHAKSISAFSACGKTPRESRFSAASSRKSHAATAQTPDAYVKSICTLLPGHSTRALEQTRSGSSEDQAANVRQVCHPAGLHVCHGACVEDLGEEPKAD
jgi:hypothetical protein